jgi:phosphohistidine phosphatase
VALETSERINPNDDPVGIDWEKESRGRDVLDVGHLPFMARLVSYLLFEVVDRSVTAYRPGSIVCLECGGDGLWQIDWMIQPILLE